MNLGNLNTSFQDSLSKKQYQEVVGIVDRRINHLRDDIEPKIDRLIQLNEQRVKNYNNLKEEIRNDIEEGIRRYSFKHSVKMASWVGVACYVATHVLKTPHDVMVKVLINLISIFL